MSKVVPFRNEFPSRRENRSIYIDFGNILSREWPSQSGEARILLDFSEAPLDRIPMAIDDDNITEMIALAPEISICEPGFAERAWFARDLPYRSAATRKMSAPRARLGFILPHVNFRSADFTDAHHTILSRCVGTWKKVGRAGEIHFDGPFAINITALSGAGPQIQTVITGPYWRGDYNSAWAPAHFPAQSIASQFAQAQLVAIVTELGDIDRSRPLRSKSFNWRRKRVNQAAFVRSEVGCVELWRREAERHMRFPKLAVHERDVVLLISGDDPRTQIDDARSVALDDFDGQLDFVDIHRYIHTPSDR